MVLNVIDDARLDRKWRQLAVIDSYMYNVRLDQQHSGAMVCTVARYSLEPFMADAVVAGHRWAARAT